MSGGKYLQQKPPRGGGRNSGGNRQNNNNFQTDEPQGGRNGKKIVMIVLIVVLVLIIAVAIGGIIYYNSVLNMMSRPSDITVETLSEEELAMLLGTVPEEMPTGPEDATETTSPEETWPEVVSDQNVTNIMIVGQAARAGEEYRLADSNILISINRERKTLTMTSILRDLRVTIPAYNGRNAGFNRINVVYHLGSYYTGKIEDSMKMMELCIEQNFGIKVDHVVEVDFEMFAQIVDMLGGIEVELSKEELDFLKFNYPYFYGEEMEPGYQHLNGNQSLGYARLRKVGNGDWERTERQRYIITYLLGNMKNMGIMDIHGLFKQVLPSIVTDMTNEEITNYAFELIPMLKDLEIQSFRIPADGTWWSTDLDPEGVHNYVIDANLQKNGELLRETIGYVAE